jgi:PAS domain S-box-containing protein
MDDPGPPGLLLDHAQDKIVLVDESGEVTYANDAVRRILGFEPADIVGDDAFDYVHPDDVEASRAAFERTIRSDGFTETTVEHRFRTAEGGWVTMESRMSNVTDEELDGYVVSSRDVSDRVAAEAREQEAATRLKELAATTGDVLWMFDGDWSELLFVNPAYEDVYGATVEDLEGDPSTFMDAVHPDDREAVRTAMERLSGGEPVDMEYRVNRGEEYGVWVWVQAEPIVEDGEVVRITGFTRDVTDRRRRERQLYVMDNLLRHNLRNDMSVILGNAKLVHEEHPGARDRTAVIRETGEDLLASAEKERTVIDMLTKDASRGRVDLATVLAESVETVRERFPEATVEATWPDSLAVEAVDELAVGMVELLENAVSHTETADPRVRLRARREGDEVVVTVVDDAPPIPEIEARVLTGTYEMNDVYHSSGLGLWLIYWVVELSDGTVVVETDAGGGNRMEVRLDAA